jgi:polyisoprenoid-binding protein YceI
VVPGELTIRGVTKPVEATGHIGEPGAGLGGDRRLEIELSATVDRRDFGMDWQAELPGGKVALANEVTLEVVLELAQAAA